MILCHLLDFHRFKDYEYFIIDATDFDLNAQIEFGTDREKEKWVIIFAGWGSTKTRIAEREKTKDGWNDYKKVSAEHSKDQWFRVRLVILKKDFLKISEFFTKFKSISTVSRFYMEEDRKGKISPISQHYRETVEMDLN